MNADACVVENDVDINRIGREIDAANIALQDAERVAERDEERAKSSKTDAAARRLELGRLLVKARGAWPARGPNAKGWGEFLAKRGIEQQRASEMMRLAGFVEGQVSPSSTNDGEKVLTLAAAGIDKRPRKRAAEPNLPAPEPPPPPSPAEPPPDPEDELQARREADAIRAGRLPASWQQSVTTGCLGYRRLGLALAKGYPRRSRTELLNTLLGLIDEIEALPGD